MCETRKLQTYFKISSNWRDIHTLTLRFNIFCRHTDKVIIDHSVVVVTFFNKTLSTAKLYQIMDIKIHEVKYNISLNDVHT